MGSFSTISIIMFLFILIDLTIFLVVGLIFFPPDGKPCDQDAVSKQLNVGNTGEIEFTCVTMEDFKTSFYRALNPYENPIDDIIWQLNLHCIAFGLFVLIIWTADKCERDYSRPTPKLRRQIRLLTAGFDMEDSAAIARHLIYY